MGNKIYVIYHAWKCSKQSQLTGPIDKLVWHQIESSANVEHMVKLFYIKMWWPPKTAFGYSHTCIQYEFDIWSPKSIQIHLSLYWLSGKTSYHQVSWSLKDARLDVRIIVSLWKVTGTSATALLPIRGACQISERLGKSKFAASKLHEIWPWYALPFNE